MLGIIFQILVYKSYDFMQYTILNDEPQFKWILKLSMNLPGAVLYRSLD